MQPPPEELERVGLCATCAYARTIRNDRGSVFYQCGRAATDPRYVPYPRLPMRECAGYDARQDPAGESSSPDPR